MKYAILIKEIPGVSQTSTVSMENCVVTYRGSKNRTGGLASSMDSLTETMSCMQAEKGITPYCSPLTCSQYGFVDPQTFRNQVPVQL